MSDFPSGFFRIVSEHNGKCLQPLSGSYEPTRIVVSSPIYGEDAGPQMWKHENGYLVNKQSSLCLDYEHGNFKRLGDINVCQWHKKVGKDAHNQKWLHRTGGLIACGDDISRVLEIKGGASHDGAEVLLKKMEVRDNAHPAQQRWRLEVEMEQSQSEPGVVPSQPTTAAPSTTWRRTDGGEEGVPEAQENPWANNPGPAD